MGFWCLFHVDETGHAKGFKKGMAEGRIEGRVEDEKIGIETGKLEIARKMKEMGDSVERIQTLTGLPMETIEQL
jgi:predicted transposase/invertase (TIGR01784 family)